jgi:cobyrinic acid a,c-diamide synthase
MATAPALILAAPASGQGKTVLTLALLRWLRNQGIAVASFKVGPDYIDPAFHQAATGRPCFNLDGWAMDDGLLGGIAAKVAVGAGLVIGEGVMGLFDGANDGTYGGTGSTADLAAQLDIPVVLIVDVRGQAASAAAVVHGFHTRRPGLPLAGVIFNRVGGAGHVQSLHDAMSDVPVPVLGYVPRDERLALPDRHLGLVQAVEHAALDTFLDDAAALVGDLVDTDALTALARPLAASADAATTFPPLGQRIAVARDTAFAFAYPHILAAWSDAGAAVLSFSPLADEAPAADADAVFLPGGYPELHAGRLAANATFLAGLHAAAARGIPVYGECGGYMVLGEHLTDANGQTHAMAGLLPVATSFAKRKMHLGYRTATLAADCALGPAGTAFRGHEFHYATMITADPAAPLFTARDARGQSLGEYGHIRSPVCGSFLHLIAADGDRRA